MSTLMCGRIHLTITSIPCNRNVMKPQCPASDRGTIVTRVASTTMVGHSAFNTLVTAALANTAAAAIPIHSGDHAALATMSPPKCSRATTPGFRARPNATLSRATHHAKRSPQWEGRDPGKQVIPTAGGTRGRHTVCRGGFYPSTASRKTNYFDQSILLVHRWKEKPIMSLIILFYSGRGSRSNKKSLPIQICMQAFSQLVSKPMTCKGSESTCFWLIRTWID
jgi:hypothetical protein